MSSKQPGLSRGQRFERVEGLIKGFDQRIRNLEMSHRIFQAMLERIAKTIEPMGQDLRTFIDKQRDMQYRLLSMQDLLKVDGKQLNDIANDMQIKDFHEASDKEDIDKGYLIGEIIDDDSVVLLTSKIIDSNAADGGILRSKVLMSEIGFPQFHDDLKGKRVGDKVIATLNGDKHEVEILGIRQVPKAVDNTASEPAKETTDSEKVNG